MKMRDRVLSGLLALSLCAGLASPAALAAGAPEETAHEPEVLAAKAGENGITLKFDPDAGDYGRVWLDVADNTVVIDSFSYTVTSDRYEIDEYGYVVLKDGAKAAAEELSISAAVSYFSGDDVVFADNVVDTTKLFDTKTNGAANQNYDYDISSESKVAEGATEKPGQVARTGQYGITCAYSDATATGSLQNGAPGKDLGQAVENVTLTAWYYDPVETGKELKASNASGAYEAGLTSDTELGLHIDVETSANSPNRYFMGIAATANNVDCNTNYYYRASTHTPNASGEWVKRDDGLRSEGWHKMQWIFTAGGMTMKWDDQDVYTDSTLTSLQYIHIANNKGQRESTRDLLQDRHFIDDISVVKNDATAAAATLTTTANITLPEPKPVLSAALLGTEDGVLASAGDTGLIRLDTTGKSIVVDTITYSVADADKAKVTLDESTGEIKWADGYTPKADETVTVTVSYTYYDGSSVKYVENFDDASAKPFSNTNYVINDGQSRTGQYGVTPYSSGGADGALHTFDSALSNVKVTAWYYDPCTETDQTYAGNPAMKFGFGATNTASAPNTNLLGVFWPSAGSATHYSYRIIPTSYDFVPSSVARTPGWQKLVWTVDETAGTKMFINDTEVAAVPGDTSITNLTLATNWTNQKDQTGMQLIYDRHYIDDISIVALDAQPKDGIATVEVTLKAPEPPKAPALTYELGKGENLRKGESGRVYLDNMEDVAIAEVTYTTDNENILVDKSGILTVKDGYAPRAGETVTVTATVTYYNKDDEIIFVDSFEGEQKFGTPASYTHSTTNPLFGRYAATPVNVSQKGPSEATFDASVTDVTVTAWYYDDYADHSAGDQLKFGFGFLGSGENTMGIFYDGTIAPLVDNITRDHYGMRVKGVSNYGNYSWGGSDVERSQGWHKFEWIVSATNGLTVKIDGKVVSTNTGTMGTGTVNTTLAPVENIAGINTVNGLRIATNWNDNATNRGYVSDRHFIDGVTVVKTGASTASMTLTSAAIPVLDIEYDHTPKDPTVDSTYPKDLTFDVEPNLDELAAVKLDGTALTAAQWHVTDEDDAPVNASFYPTGRLVIDSSAFKGLADGSHTLTLVMTSGSTHDIAFTAAANTHTATDYYLSNSGSDSNDGHSAAQAWASFAKLSTVTFGPGDHIYLDATSVWSGVQFQPKGSGAEGKPIVITSYNNGGDSSKRPILNGDGTVANKDTANGGHSYLAFEPWRKFYPSGTIELFNVEYWEVRGIEITNYASAYTQEGTGRNGIAVIHDFFETQGITTLPSGNQALEEAFYRAGKLQHIVVEDCYIHDVTGYHPGSGASGAGGKMSGGINVYGPYDGLTLDNNIIMYCDVEGIRNDVLAWRGDTRTQFPCYMEDISISNNFIVGVPGDGVVISSCIEPKLAHNYLTDAGYSYLVPNAGAVASGTAPKAMGNRQDPIIVNNSTNFAGLWFIGTMDAVAEYNESVNNVWTCNDGEAFDADMYTWGTVFQYNYTYRNNGGLCLFMSGNQMDDGTIVRYNVSVEDGEGVGTPNDGRKAVFHYNKEPDAIYNNLFILGDNVRGMFGGDSCTAYFYNNIVVKPSGEIGSFNLNTTSNSNAAAKDMTSKTVMSNNLFYPAAILNNVTGSFTKQNNITPDSLDGIFVDLDGFMEAQPVKALKGRSDLDGTAVNMTQDKGAGVAMSAEAGRSVTTPDGTGFDYTQFEGIKTVEGSPTIGAGVPVTLTIWPQTDDVHPLTMDFFRNDITGITAPDIGPYQWSADASRYVKLTLDGNGSDAQVEPLYAKIGGTVTLPGAPVKTGSTFQGWYESADFTGSPVSGAYTVSGSGITLYAKWEKEAGSCDVAFDTQGGSYVAPQNGLASGSKVTRPAPNPTREGHRFLGWYKDAEGTTAWDFDVDTVTVDTVIYAQWRALYYTVTFNSNGGDTQPDPGAMQVTLPASSLGGLPTPPARDGHVFLGWNTAADGSGTAFTGDTRISGNMTVYAQWRLLGNFIVTFSYGGGSAVAPESVPEGESVNKPADPTWSGYTFEGWYMDADCTDGSEYDFTAPVTADMTLYAKWTQNSNPGPSESPAPSEMPDVPVIQNPTSSKSGDDTTTTVEKNDDGSTTTTVTDNKTGTVTETTEKPDGTVETKETREDGTVTETTEKPDGSSESVKTEPDGTVTETAIDPEGAKVEKVTTPEEDVTITVTDKDGEELAKVEIPAELPALETRFVDVPAGHWAEEGINEIAALGVVKGVGNDCFNMTDGIKRGDLATILFRLSNGQEGYDLQFSDVPADKYYADGIAWAARTGVVTGLSADTYAPEATVTREQLATMLYRYAKLLGLDANVSGDALDSFADKDSVQSWADDGMTWCVANGVIKGKSNDTLDPGAEASRAEVAVMLTRFIGLMK